MIDLVPFKALIKERCGLLFEGNNAEKLARALAERSEAAGIGQAEYYLRLRSSEAEFQELVNLLTINETYFFREPEQLRLLVERMVPRLLAQRGDGLPLRILSAGCSSGEEPYSLAIALREKYGGGAERLFEFHGGDIDSAVLARARQGRYSGFSFRSLAVDIRDRYFDGDGHHYVLHDDVRRQVEFRELNLLAAQPPDALRDFDVILFRNVSIYFDAPTRRSIQRNLAALLKADGILMTGTAETLANDFGILTLVEEEGQFYFVKGQPPLGTATLPGTRREEPPAIPPVRPTPARLPIDPGPARPSAAAPAAPSAVAPVDLDRLVRMTAEHRYEEALPLLEARLAADARDAGARLLKAHILLERKDFAAAAATAAAVLDTDPWSVDALLLLGLAAKWRGETDAAIRHFKQAVYARQDCWPAHYYLAELHRAGDAVELARREYRVVLQLLEREGADCGARVIPLGLPAREVGFLCRHQLARLDVLAAPAPAR